jgi:chromosome segregation ATPase
MSRFTPAQRQGILAEARANVAERAAQRAATSTRMSGFEIIYKTRDADADGTPAGRPLPERTTLAQSESELLWWQWVDNRIDEFGKAVGEVLGQFRKQAREQIETVKRELELTRRELNTLREEIGVERKLRALRDEIEQVRGEVPKLPAVVAQLKAEQKRLERELEETKKKLLHVRADQSVTNYSLSELNKKVATTKAKAAASVELKLETNSSSLIMRDVHPDAARALQEFAAQALADDETMWFSNPVGRA